MSAPFTPNRTQWRLLNYLAVTSSTGHPYGSLNQLLDLTGGSYDDAVALEERGLILAQLDLLPTSLAARYDAARDPKVRLTLTGRGTTWVRDNPHNRVLLAVGSRAWRHVPLHRVVAVHDLDLDALVAAYRASHLALFLASTGATIHGLPDAAVRTGATAPGDGGELTAELTSDGLRLIHPCYPGT